MYNTPRLVQDQEHFEENTVDMKPGEIVDKWTILRMKVRAQPDNNSVLGLCIAHGTASDQILAIGDPLLLDLIELNAKIWTLESVMAKIPRTPGSFVLAGTIAQEITNINKLRMAAIERINLEGELNAKDETCQDGKDQVV